MKKSQISVKTIIISSFLCLAAIIFIIILLMGHGNPIEGFHNYNALQNGPTIAAQKEREITIVGDYLGAKTLIYSGGTTHSYYTVY